MSTARATAEKILEVPSLLTSSNNSLLLVPAVIRDRTSSRFIWRRSFGVRLALFSTSSAEGPRGGQDNGTWWNSKLHIIISLSALSSLCLYHYLRERKEGEALLLPVASLSSEGDGVGNGGRRRSDRYNFLTETVEKVSPSVVPRALTMTKMQSFTPFKQLIMMQPSS